MQSYQRDRLEEGPDRVLVKTALEGRPNLRWQAQKTALQEAAERGGKKGATRTAGGTGIKGSAREGGVPRKAPRKALFVWRGRRRGQHVQLGAPERGSPRGGRPRRSAGTSCLRGPRSRRGALLRPRPQQIAAVLQYPRTLAARHWHGPGVGNNCAVPMATRQRPPPPRPLRTAGPSPRPPPPPPERSGNPGNGGCGSNSDRGPPRLPPLHPPAARGAWPAWACASRLGRTRTRRGRRRRKSPLPLCPARKAGAGGSPRQGRSLCSLLTSRRLPSLPGVPRPSSWDGRRPWPGILVLHGQMKGTRGKCRTRLEHRAKASIDLGIWVRPAA